MRERSLDHSGVSLRGMRLELRAGCGACGRNARRRAPHAKQGCAPSESAGVFRIFNCTCTRITNALLHNVRPLSSHKPAVRRPALVRICPPPPEVAPVAQWEYGGNKLETDISPGKSPGACPATRSTDTVSACDT